MVQFLEVTGMVDHLPEWWTRSYEEPPSAPSRFTCHAEAIASQIRLERSGIVDFKPQSLQAHPECQGIRLVKLKSLEKYQGLANWDASLPPSRA